MKYFRYITTLAYAALIFFLSSLSWQGESALPHLDKAAHVVLYLGLGGFVFWALRTTKLRYSGYIGGIAFLITVLYGLSDEIHQYFVPGRECSMLDLLADALGAVLGVVIASKLANYLRRKGDIIKYDY